MKYLMLLYLLIGFSLPAKAFFGNFSKDCTKKIYSTNDLLEKSKPGVVVIKTNISTGSGFVVRHVKNRTIILTNSHVINGAKNITVEWSDGNQDNAIVVLDGGASNTLTDLALLKVDGIEGKVLNLKKKQAIVGADVIAIGAPQGLEFSLTKGIVSSLRDSGRVIQTDTAINPGSSGGPLINQSGCVVGVNTLGMLEKDGLNFAISSQIAQRFVDKYDPNIKQNVFNRDEAIVIKNKDEKPRFKEKDINVVKPEKKNNYQALLNNIEEIYTKEGKERETIKASNDLLNIKETSLGYYYLAYAQDSIGSHTQAIESLNRAISLDYGWDNLYKAVAYNNRGYAKSNLGNFAGAVSDYTSAIEINPEDPTSYLNRGFAKLDAEYNGIDCDYCGSWSALNDFTKTIEVDTEKDPNLSGLAYYERSKIWLKERYWLRGKKQSTMKMVCFDQRRATELGFQIDQQELNDNCRQGEKSLSEKEIKGSWWD